MIEVIATVYIASFALSGLVTLTTLLFMRRRMHSPRAQRLNANLGRIGYFWSQNQSDFAPYTPEAFAHDQRKTLRDYALVGLLLAFLSAPGFVFLCIFTLSMHILARPRLEKAVFASPLAMKSDLSVGEVEAALAEVKARVNYVAR